MNEILIKIQNELSVPKNQKNTYGGYNYRSCEDILEAVKPLLSKYKILLTISDELVNIGERYYIKASVRLRSYDIKLDSNVIETTGYAREEETKKGMDGSQITGASSSYARKYALNAMFLIDDTKDSDSTNEHEDKPARTYPASQKQKDFIKELYMKKMGEVTEAVEKKINTLTSDQASEKITEYKSMPDLSQDRSSEDEEIDIDDIPPF